MDAVFEFEQAARQFVFEFPVIDEGVPSAVVGPVDGFVTAAGAQNPEAAQALLADAGCRVDAESGRIRFPAALVEECLRLVPSHFRIKARDRRKDVMVGGDAFYFMQGMGMNYVDLETWERRARANLTAELAALG